MSRTCRGEDNPNWKPKFSYFCPVCGKELLLTARQKELYTEVGRACSKVCGNIKCSASHTGMAKPWARARMLNANPMKTIEGKTKVSVSMKTRFASGELEELRTKLSSAGKRNLIAYNTSREGRKRTSDRMKTNNPMKNPVIAAKVGKQIADNYANGKMQPPSFANRFERGYYINRLGFVFHYDSGWELKRMEFLDTQPDIRWEKIRRRPRVPYTINGKAHTYFPDFKIWANGKIIIEEIGDWIEGKEEKIKAANIYFASIGYHFYVLTREEDLNAKTWLQSQMCQDKGNTKSARRYSLQSRG